MHESRTIYFTDKVFDAASLRWLSEFIYGEYLRLCDISSSKHYDLCLQFEKGLEFTSDTPDIWERLPHNRLMRMDITMRLSNRDEHGMSEYNVRLRVWHAGGTQDNTVTIAGTDVIWINHIFTEISDALDSAQPQVLSSVPRLGILAGLWIAWVTVLHELARIASASKLGGYLSSGPDGWIILVAVALGLSFWTGVYIIDSWPSVEISVGPAHRMWEKKRRRKVKWVLGAIIIPIFLAWIDRFIR